MSNLIRRENTLYSATSTRVTAATSLSVVAYEVGAQVGSASSGTTATVRLGHGFADGDKFIVFRSGSYVSGSFNTVNGTPTATTIPLTASQSLSVGDFLVNLGPDGGSSTPNFDASGRTIYSTMDTTTSITDSTVTTNAQGVYGYWHAGTAGIWELVLSAGVPTGLIPDAFSPGSSERSNYEIRYAHLFATGGLGTQSSPWTVSGSNCIQAALNDLPAFGVGGGGIVRMIPGVYDLGSTTGAVTIAATSDDIGGITIEGYNPGWTESDAYDNAAILTFSGTGSAFKIGDFTHTLASLEQTTHVKLRNFKLLQTGTDGTGIGLHLRYFRRGLIEDVLVEDFAIGCALVSISDFNTFRRFYTRDCQTAGVYVGYTTGQTTPNGQCNGNVFHECDIMNLSRDSGYSNCGIFIDSDSVETTIRDSRFHNFDTSGSTAGAIVCRDSNRLTVDSNYFEGNHYAVHVTNSDATDEFGFTVTNNYITQTESVAIRTNCGSSGLIQGATITGNHITNPNTSSPYDACTGIVLHNQVRNAVVDGNEYVNMTTADLTIGGASTTYVRCEDGAITTTGAATIGGAAAITGTATAAGVISTAQTQLSSADLNVTGNDAVVTAGKGVINLTNVSGTNTITLNAPSSVNGQILILRLAALTAGTLTLADSGNCALSAAWVPDAGDTLTLVANGVIWYEIARSGN